MKVRVLAGPVVLGNVMAQTGDVLDVLPPYAETVLAERPGVIEEVGKEKSHQGAKSQEKPTSAKERKALLDAAHGAPGPEPVARKPIKDKTAVVVGEHVEATTADIFATTSTVAGSQVHVEPAPAVKGPAAVQAPPKEQPAYVVKGADVVKAAPK
jgi:hypothetical protein